MKFTTMLLVFLSVWPLVAKGEGHKVGFIDKMFGRESIPEWASYMTPDEYSRFIKIVENELRRRGVQFARNDAVVEVTAGPLPPARYGLWTLAQQCKQMDQKEWVAGVAKHFDDAVQGAAASEQLAAIAGDFSKVESMLRVRLYPPEWIKERKEDIVLRHDLPGLETVLCFDLPTMVIPVSTKYAAQWKVPIDKAFDTGIKNSTAQEHVETQNVDVAPGMAVTAYVADEVWHSANVLTLEKLIGPVGEYGALVGLPHRHMLLVHKITGGDMPGLFGGMGRMTRGIYQEGPGSISPDLFWYIDGKFERVPVEMTTQGMVVTMPGPAFNERVMKPLGLAK